VQFAPTSAGRITATLTAASEKSRVTAIDALTGTGTGLGSAPGHIYWTETMPNAVNGTINQAGLDGSSPQLFPAPGQPFGIAVDASHIYWTDLVGLDYWIWPGRAAGLGSSLSDLLGRLPARSPSARLSGGAGPV
jgi:hypothetical protein